VSERYFTPAEVERLIPALAEIMARVMAAREEVVALRGTQRNEQQRITMAGGGVLDQAAWRRRAERLKALAQTMEEGLREVAAMGGMPKDIGLGLVDFPHQRDGRVVNLCWKYGEKDIRYWHGLDEGYGGRKPL
jgi:hypothetical protein